MKDYLDQAADKTTIFNEMLFYPGAAYLLSLALGLCIWMLYQKKFSQSWNRSLVLWGSILVTCIALGITYRIGSYYYAEDLQKKAGACYWESNNVSCDPAKKRLELLGIELETPEDDF